jgi:Fibronectin type III domain
MCVINRRWGSCSLRNAVHVVGYPMGWAVALALLLTSYTATAQVTLAWDASTSMVDSYWLHYGTQSGIYTTRVDVGAVTTYMVSGLTSGETYYFAVTAYDRTDNVESVFSNEVSAMPSSSQPSLAGVGQTPSGGGGCTINPGAGFDPVVMGTTALWLTALIWKRARKSRPGL